MELDATSEEPDLRGCLLTGTALHRLLQHYVAHGGPVQRLALHSSSHLMITTDAMLKVQVQEMRDLMSSSNSEYNLMQIFS